MRFDIAGICFQHPAVGRYAVIDRCADFGSFRGAATLQIPCDGPKSFKKADPTLFHDLLAKRCLRCSNIMSMIGRNATGLISAKWLLLSTR